MTPSKLICALGLLALGIPAIALAAGDAAEGKKTYDVLCMVCHGVTGGGDGPAGAAIDPPPRNFASGEFKFDADKDGVIGTDEDLFAVIKKGGAAFGGPSRVAVGRAPLSGSRSPNTGSGISSRRWMSSRTSAT